MLTIRANKKAVDFIRAKAAVSPGDFGRLPAELRVKSFTTAAAEDVQTLRRILDALESLPSGADWNAKRREIAGMIGGGKDADPQTRRHMQARARLIVQTAGRQAYAAARWAEMRAMTDVFPYWRYVADGDERTRPSHAALDGKVVRHDDPFWQAHFPPWDFGCRCTAVPMTEAEAKAAGIADASRIPGAAPDGYRFNPSDLNRDPDEMAESYGEEWPAFCEAMRAMEVSERAAGIGETVLDPGGETARGATAWSWFYREFSRRDGLLAAQAAARGREAVFVRRADTGAKVAAALGGRRSVQIPAEALRQAGEGVRLSYEHGHPGGTVFPSPADMALAKRLNFGLLGVNTRAHHIAYQIADASDEFGGLLAAFARRRWSARTQREWLDFLKASVDAGKIRVTWEATRNETL